MCINLEVKDLEIKVEKTYFEVNFHTYETRDVEDSEASTSESREGNPILDPNYQYKSEEKCFECG